MEKKVSIIIPVYNTELYLEECLHSVITQTFQDMEIILIDDGSTDRSPEIIKIFAEKDKRIKIITRPNRGVSAARNRGLRAASGEYILFVDSDDTIIPNTVETLCNKARETESELVVGNEVFLHEDNRLSLDFKRNDVLNNLMGIQGKECYIKLLEADVFPPSAPLFFIKRKLIIENNLFFKEGIIHEDVLWCVEAMLSAKRVSLIDFNYYQYRQREGSIMHSDNMEFRIQSLFTVIKELDKRAKKENDLQETTEHIYTLIYGLFSYIGKLLPYVKTQHVESLLQTLSVQQIYNHFCELLIEIYPSLSYSQQRICVIGLSHLISSWNFVILP